MNPEPDSIEDASSPNGSGQSLFGRLANWSEAEIPLPAMMRALAEEQGGRARQGLMAMADRLEQGDDLPTAFAAARNRFPRQMREQLGLAAQAGDLRLALPVLAQQEASRQVVTRRLMAVLSYPLIVLSFAMVLALFLSAVIVRPFTELYDEFQLELPVMTELVLTSLGYFPWVLGIIAACLAVIALLSLLPGAGRLVHWLATSLPLFGSLWIWLGHQSLASQLAFYLNAGIPLPIALDNVTSGLRDRNLAHCVRRLAAACEQGLPLSQAMEKSIHFERSLISFIQTGERSSSLPTALNEASELYHRQIGLHLTFIHRIVPPCVVLFVACGICLIAISLFLPLTRIIEGLT